MSEHRVFPLQPSRFQYNLFKDYLHLYFMVGLIPCGLIILYSNLFIGPATLSEIPEDYTPKHWEYYRVMSVIDFTGSLLIIIIFILASYNSFYCKIYSFFPTTGV